MNNQILLLAYISVAVGIFSGIVIVLLLSIFRQRQVINSLISPQDFLGMVCTVEIPFDKNSKGKIRVNVKESTVEFIAFTEDDWEFTRGEKAFIVGVENNKVWVVSKDWMGKLSDEKS
ncbi:MAG: hypothetical protein AB4080_19820 [Trichodesmium sp.]